MRRIPLLLLAALGMTALLAACDPAESTDVATGGPVAGMCLAGASDCDDMPVDDPAGAIRSLLGVAHADLGDDVRIARIGTESFALTEDYVVGRLTVELDPDADGVNRVVKVTLEDEGGPVTVTE